MRPTTTATAGSCSTCCGAWCSRSCTRSLISCPCSSGSTVRATSIALSREELTELAAEIRRFLVSEVSKTGGHLGPNLGVVELTLAIHRTFHSPHDAIVFDTGHQSYVHKLLTGRQDFSTLRQKGGLAGYPQRSESVHDIVESSHASSSLSWADGISRAFAMTGQGDRYVVAVVGDGALTGGMTWEALNNISDDNSRRLVMIVNDNGRSYGPTIGGMARFLNTVRTRRAYRSLYHSSRRLFDSFGAPGRAIYRGTRGAVHGFMARFSNNEALYSNLEIKYIGPVHGHDLPALEVALKQAKEYDAPVIVHVITQKGRGYEPALADVADRFHAIGQIDPETGEPVEVASKPSWTSVFADEIVALAERNPKIVGITAAMMRPDRAPSFRREVPGARLRRRHRGAARRRQRGRPRLRRPPSGRPDLRDLHQPRVRPGDDGCRPAPRGRHLRARPGRHHGTGRTEPPRHVGPRAAADRAQHPACRAPRRHAAS